MAKRKKKLEPAGEIIAEVVAEVGRPSDFQPEFCEQVEKLCLLGATDAQIAEFFDKAVSTIYAWKLDYPEFSEAIKRGKMPANAEVAKSLFTRAQFHEYTEQQAIKVKEVEYKDGKRVREVERVEVVEVKRMLPPSDTSMIFWLKNRFPEQWRDKTEHAITHKHEDRLTRRRDAINKAKERSGDAADRTALH